MELDTASSLLCVAVSLAAGFIVLLFLGTCATQWMADAATDTTKATTTRGFEILQPANPAAQPALPVEPLPTLLSAATPLRYAVLHHTGIPMPHYDLMFELHPGARLATWRCPDWPVESGALLERLADHRLEYLDYEGPVSNNRGQVARVLGGTLRLEAFSNDVVIVTTDVDRRFTFRREGDTSLWRLELGQATT
jgi:hypothetical protein